MSHGGIGVVIAAAGSGSRFRSGGAEGEKKQFLRIGGQPLLCLSLAVFADLEDVETIVVVAPERELSRVEKEVAGFESIEVVAGGVRRQDSVRNGLERFWDRLEFGLVHDAARPLLRVEDARKVADAVIEHGAAAIGYGATDSIQEIASPDRADVVRSLRRDVLWQVQTPQGARCEHFRRAYDALEDGTETSDEVGLLRGAGIDVRLVEGARDNIKVTLPGDEKLAEFLLERRKRPGG